MACVLPQVWHLRVDVHVLDHCGNLTDACGLSALAALMAFRRPDVTVGGGEDGQAITVHSPEVREPLPLSIHHLPVPVTFALFEVRREGLLEFGRGDFLFGLLEGEVFLCSDLEHCSA